MEETEPKVPLALREDVQKITDGHEQIAQARLVATDEVLEAVLRGQELANRILHDKGVLELHGHTMNPVLVESADMLETLSARLYETLEKTKMLAGHDKWVAAQKERLNAE